jgi:hypothetical protein
MVQLKKEKIEAMLDGSTKWAYWIVGVLIVGGISYILFNRLNKQVAAVLVFLAGMLALYFYYVKWFVVGMDVWPPFQGFCPDFLTPVAVNSPAADTIYCADMVGVSTSFPKLDQAYQTQVARGEPLSKINGSYPAGVIYFSTLSTDTEANRTKAKNAGLTWISLLGSS